jgi:hypothetical protein
MTPVELMRRISDVSYSHLQLEMQAMKARTKTFESGLNGSCFFLAVEEAKRLDALCEASMAELRGLCTEADERRAEFTEEVLRALVSPTLVMYIDGVLADPVEVLMWRMDQYPADELRAAEWLHRGMRKIAAGPTSPPGSDPAAPDERRGDGGPAPARDADEA